MEAMEILRLVMSGGVRGLVGPDWSDRGSLTPSSSYGTGVTAPSRDIVSNLSEFYINFTSSLRQLHMSHVKFV